MTYKILKKQFVVLFDKEEITREDISNLLKANTLKATLKYPKSEDLVKQTKDWITLRLAQGFIIENNIENNIENDIRKSTNRRKASKQN